MTSFYWITRLDAINMFFGIAAAIIGTAAILLFVFGAVNKNLAYDKEDRDYQSGKKLIRDGVICTMVTLALSFCLVFIPTTKEMCAIYMVDYLKDNEKVQKMPEQIIDAASAFLEEQANKGKERKK